MNTSPENNITASDVVRMSFLSDSRKAMRRDGRPGRKRQIPARAGMGSRESRAGSSGGSTARFRQVLQELQDYGTIAMAGAASDAGDAEAARADDAVGCGFLPPAVPTIRNRSRHCFPSGASAWTCNQARQSGSLQICDCSFQTACRWLFSSWRRRFSISTWSVTSAK